ncbi:MAG: MBL fold metallo-hydrolase [candidate division WOR-3 bacterium]
MKLGKLDLEIINDGIFYLDGGAMFGVVPKVMWSKLNPADDKNRIELALNLLLIKGKDFKILIDTGIGDKLKERFIEIYSVQRGKGLIQNLNDLGIKPDEIDIVINTHLHFDHCGGNTIYNEDKRAIPTFCRAKYFVQKAEWADAVSPNERTKASYLLENFLPIQNSGQ